MVTTIIYNDEYYTKYNHIIWRKLPARNIEITGWKLYKIYPCLKRAVSDIP